LFGSAGVLKVEFHPGMEPPTKEQVERLVGRVRRLKTVLEACVGR
jgi:hypothetical protein